MTPERLSITIQWSAIACNRLIQNRAWLLHDYLMSTEWCGHKNAYSYQDSRHMYSPSAGDLSLPVVDKKCGEFTPLTGTSWRVACSVSPSDCSVYYLHASWKGGASEAFGPGVYLGINSQPVTHLVKHRHPHIYIITSIAFLYPVFFPLLYFPHFPYPECGNAKQVRILQIIDSFFYM
jgi:hypothetical protein